MPLSSKLVGHLLPEATVTVTPRMALSFAAGIMDDASTTYDDADSRFVVSPFYCASLEWNIASKARASDLGLQAAEVVREVHAGQSTTFHRLIRPGMTVNVSGKIIGIRSTRAGALARSVLEIKDSQTGFALSSTTTVGLYRDVAVDGPDNDHSESEHRSDPADMVESRHNIALDRWFAHRYTECAAIWNPIHTERAVALPAGLPDTIVHGTALWALAGRTVLTQFASGAPHRLQYLSGRFAAMVRAGTGIVVQLRHSPQRPHEIAFTVLNSEGKPAIADGVARLAPR